MSGKDKSKKGKRSKAELLNLLDKYKKGQISHDEYLGILIKNNRLDPDPMQGFRNHRSELNAAEFNKGE